MSAAHLDELLALLRFPSISTDPERKGDVARCADGSSASSSAIGLKATLHPTAGHPIVIARNDPPARPPHGDDLRPLRRAARR